MNILEVIMEALSPRSSVISKHEQKFKRNEEALRNHLQKLEQTAIRNVTEATDEIAEFQHDTRT